MNSSKQIDIAMMGSKLSGYVCSGRSSFSYTEI